MKKSTKLATAGMLSLSMVMPNVAFVAAETVENNNININIEKRSILLGDTSKVSISFKEKPNSDSITLNLICYDMPLSTELTYNESTKAYEGTINFNKSPESLYVWSIDNIVINSVDNPQTITKEDLEKEGLDLKQYDIIQEYLVYNNASLASYMEKTAAPIKKLAGAERQDTAISISKEGWSGGANKVIIVNGSAIADGITATPLANTYDAPILLSTKDSISNETKEEIKRLNPSEVIVVGGDSVISESVINQVKSTTNTKVRRLAGKDRHDTSLKIAQEIDANHDITKIYMANGYNGEVDALTIAAKAGSDKEPIILTHKEEIPKDTYTWLKSQKLKDAYFIGGESVIATSVIHQANDITSNSAYSNRVYGSDRHETNAKVIERFYTQDELEAVLVARSDVLVDALSAGPLAAKLNSPILITPTTYVSKYHENNLSKKSAGIVYQIGGTIQSNVMNDIAYKLSKHNSGTATVVIDAGHGGADSGAVNHLDSSIQEKNYTLDAALGANEYLRQQGINVVLTRDSDITQDVPTKVSISNAINPDYFVSIHYNAYDKGNNSGGTEVYYQSKDEKGGPSKTLSTNILNRVLEKYSFRNRGIKIRLRNDGKDYLYVNRESTAPAALVECAFIDNASDIKQLDTEQKRRDIGVQIAKGIEDTLK